MRGITTANRPGPARGRERGGSSSPRAEGGTTTRRSGRGTRSAAARPARRSADHRPSQATTRSARIHPSRRPAVRYAHAVRRAVPPSSPVTSVPIRRVNVGSSRAGVRDQVEQSPTAAPSRRTGSAPSACEVGHDQRSSRAHRNSTLSSRLYGTSRTVGQAGLVDQLSVDGWTVSPRKSRRKSACFSSTWTSTPARASSRPSTIPAGPPPTTTHVAARHHLALLLLTVRRLAGTSTRPQRVTPDS